MKSFSALVLASALVAGCADEAGTPAPPPVPAGAAEVVTEPEQDVLADTLVIDDDVVIDDADLEAGEVEDVDEGM